MVREARAHGAGTAPTWLLVLLCLAWLTVTLGVVAYVGGFGTPV